MAARLGLDRAAVLAAAVCVIDHDGLDALTMSRLAADLGIRVPSLYAHVEGQAALRRELWLWAVDDLGDRLRESVMGRSGVDAFAELARALRHYARTRPGRYALTLASPRPLDAEARAARRRANAAFAAATRSLRLDPSTARHAGRALRAAVHGFVDLESQDALGSPDVDESFEHLLRLLVAGLAPAPAAATA